MGLNQGGLDHSWPMPSGSAFMFGPHACASSTGRETEWLVTDGVGGFAMGTVSGLRTRRYHALLVAPGHTADHGPGLGPGRGRTAQHALAPAEPGRSTHPGGTPARKVGLVALDPTVALRSGATVALAVHEWVSGAINPQGHHHLERFDLVDGLPRWRWRIGEVVVERELAMVYGRPAVAVVHRLLSGPAVRLSLTALCTWRAVDGERDHRGPRPRVTTTADGAVVEGAYRLAGPGWRTGGDWYLGAYARQEAERGLNAVEDLWAAGSFTATLEAGQTLEVSAWAGDLDTAPPRPSATVTAARKRARKVIRAAKPVEDADATLALAADAFIVRPPGADAPDVIAGYPWFGTYPRDTMTSYEGLFLRTGRADEGRELLRGYATRLTETFDTPREDADWPLWFVHALDRHVAGTGDTDLAGELLGTVEGVIAAYTKGTGDGVCADRADGLLTIDADRVGLTWMNARLPGGPVTPRDGKPVEVNALWANALGAAVALREAVGRDAADLVGRRDLARAHFGKRFGAPGGWLFDLLDARPAAYPLGGGSHHDDPVLRPNQLLAYSLPHAPLSGADPRAIEAVGAALLTPLGPRTLAPYELGYHGTHRGGVAYRDAAYHQGTVWPWLMGPYVESCRVAGLPVHGLLGALEAHLGEAGLGSVSETADGNPPHRPTGSPFSARSVAELVRARNLARNVRPQGARHAIR
jgi:predicted glycogen debranching enzyme